MQETLLVNELFLYFAEFIFSIWLGHVLESISTWVQKASGFTFVLNTIKLLPASLAKR